MVRIYFISDRNAAPGEPPERALVEAIEGGVDMVQVRDKDLPARSRLAMARAAVDAARSAEAEVYVNSRLDIAAAAGAHGVHLPAEGVPAESIRAGSGRRLAIGVSTHSVEEARAAERAGADFITYGPVFDTPSKRRYGAPLGLPSLHEALAAVRVPVYALGGIHLGNVEQVLLLPVSGIAVITAIASAPDRRMAVQALRAAVRRSRGGED